MIAGPYGYCRVGFGDVFLAGRLPTRTGIAAGYRTLNIPARMVSWQRTIVTLDTLLCREDLLVIYREYSVSLSTGPP